MKGNLDHQIFHKAVRTLQLSLPFEAHAELWAAYQALFDQEKKEYFKNKVKGINTLHQHMDLTMNSIKFVISVDIVDTIIGDIFFCNDEQLLNDSDNDNDTAVAKVIAKRAAKKSKEKVNAMKLFIKQSDESTYKVTIKNIMHFELAMDHVSIGMLFWQIATAIQQAKDCTKTTKLARINDLIVG
ncbi:unnamed protein product [Sphagnum balticum]